MVNIRDCLTLKACRVIANIKANELGQAVGVTDDTIYKWEKGKSSPTMTQMKKIQKCFADKGFYLNTDDIEFY